MTDNRFAYWTTAYGFAYCKNALAVLDEYARHFHVGCSDSDLKAMRDDALARIRELTPPPEKPVVSEEARERAATLLAKIMADCALSRRNPDAVDTALDRIIDALGYTVEDCDNCGNQKCMKCYRNFPHEEDECANDCPECCPAENAESLGNLAPAPPPVVEINLTALQHIRVAMSAHSVVSDAMGKWPDFGDVPDIPISTEIPMRITLNDNGVSVLRIGGEQ